MPIYFVYPDGTGNYAVKVDQVAGDSLKLNWTVATFSKYCKDAREEAERLAEKLNRG